MWQNQYNIVKFKNKIKLKKKKSFDKSKYHIQVEPHSPFVTGLFHLADCLQGLSML